MSNVHTASEARWRRRKEARPAEILAAALDCFTERGFAATRLEDVARRAGVTKGTLYLYFPNKEELFKAMVREAVVATIARGEARVGEAAEPAPQLLEAVLRELTAQIETPASAIPKLVIAEAGNFPDLARFYLDEVIHRGRSLVRRVLRAGIARGEFRPIDLERVIDCVIAPVIMAMLWRHSFAPYERDDRDVEALCRVHLQLLSEGLRPREGRSGAGAQRRRAQGSRR
jgi:AcrR family transcriptional regulator